MEHNNKKKKQKVTIPDNPPLVRTISNLSHKEDNEGQSQTTNEYFRNVQLSRMGFLSDSGKGPEFDPETLARAVRADCVPNDKNFCEKTMNIIYSFMNTNPEEDYKRGGKLSKRTIKSNRKKTKKKGYTKRK